jgi:hypothetical protein
MSGAAHPPAASHRHSARHPVARFLRHLFSDRWSVRRAFPPAALKAIERAIGEGEARHDGELRFVVESMLHLGDLVRGVSPRDRAIGLFAHLRVWDTEHNSGVLIYVLLADRRVEIVADRGIDARIGAQGWQAVCSTMQAAYRRGAFEEGSVAGVRAISDLLAAHFPRTADKKNELPNKPIVL